MQAMGGDSGDGSFPKVQVNWFIRTLFIRATSWEKPGNIGFDVPSFLEPVRSPVEFRILIVWLDPSWLSGSWRFVCLIGGSWFRSLS